jgi:Xaa-Pro aminopeptidase
MSQLERCLGKDSLDGFLVTNETNASYLSGFEGHDSLLLLAGKKRFFITDSRYIEEAKSSLKYFECVLVRSTTYETLLELASSAGIKRMGFESMDMPYGVASRLKRLMKKTELVATKGVVENLRAVKDAGEIASIRKSIRLAKRVFKRVAREIRTGRTEEDLSRLIDLEFLKNGARPAFDTIVAGGPNTSKPHARPTRASIPRNSFVMVDIGCNIEGYNSDLTRMIAVGKVKDELLKIYGIVAAAQEAALGVICPGAPIKDVDAAAREHIRKKGYGEYFGHALGHGVGMAVHEEPTISKNSEAELKPGMVFTVEPAIYLPRLGGVRIEDMVLVTEDGCEILTG